MPSAATHLGVFAKYWRSGRVKTRLAKSIGEELARDIYLKFIKCLLERLRHAGTNRTLVFTPTESESAFSELVPAEWQLEPQTAGELGQRMKAFFSASTLHFGKTALIGSDMPDLRAELVDTAFKHLDEVDLVLGPATDGGYYLIAMREPLNVFDNIDWSTDRVLDQTIAQIEQQGIRYRLMPKFRDVDELEDFEHLLSRLDSPDSDQFDQMLLQKLQPLSERIDA